MLLQQLQLFLLTMASLIYMLVDWPRHTIHHQWVMSRWCMKISRNLLFVPYDTQQNHNSLYRAPETLQRLENTRAKQYQGNSRRQIVSLQFLCEET